MTTAKEADLSTDQTRVLLRVHGTYSLLANGTKFSWSSRYVEHVLKGSHIASLQPDVQPTSFPKKSVLVCVLLHEAVMISKVAGLMSPSGGYKLLIGAREVLLPQQNGLIRTMGIAEILELLWLARFALRACPSRLKVGW